MCREHTVSSNSKLQQFFLSVSDKIKCERYWPLDEKSFTSGEIEIVLVSETHKREWVVREFNVSKVRCDHVVMQRLFFATKASFLRENNWA